jgi:predicted dehydrogenase
MGRRSRRSVSASSGANPHWPTTASLTATWFGAAHWFTDARQLAGHPDVDLVVITVKVPFRLELDGSDAIRSAR